MSEGVQRKVTVILAADAAGYSREMEADELGTVASLRSARVIFTDFIERHRGRIANTAGDGLIAECPSAVDAVQCAVDVQRELNKSQSSGDGALRFRIGIHLGDVIIDGHDLLGDGVNLAARLQTMAEPGGILISQQVYDQVRNKLPVQFEYLGKRRPKNFIQDVPVYKVPLISEPKLSDVEAQQRQAPSAKLEHPVDEATERRRRIIHPAKALGAIWAILLVVDLAAGGSFWSHWTAIAALTALGLKASSLFVRGRFEQYYASGIVVICALALINIMTWSGDPWALWFVGLMLAVTIVRRLRFRSS